MFDRDVINNHDEIPILFILIDVIIISNNIHMIFKIIIYRIN